MEKTTGGEGSHIGIPIETSLKLDQWMKGYHTVEVLKVSSCPSSVLRITVFLDLG